MSAHALHHRTQQIGGSQVHSWGPEPAPGSSVILALHGWSDGGIVFQFLAERFAGRAVLFAPDAPGHGGTPWTGGGFSVNDLVPPAGAVLDDLVRLYPFLAEEGVFVYGHSMGALTAAGLAARRPDAIRGLILEEPPHRPLSLRRLRRRYALWLQRLAAMEPPTRLAFMRDLTQWPAEELHLWWLTKTQFDLALLARFDRWGTSAPQLLAAIRVPTLLLHGRGRGWHRLNPGQLWWWLLRTSGSDLRVAVLDTQHNLRREAPEELASAVLCFLAR